MDSTSSTGRKGFPPTIMLVDTGERRYPQPGEHYYWLDDDGIAHGPHHAPIRVSGDWVSGPESYAIYHIDDGGGRVH